MDYTDDRGMFMFSNGQKKAEWEQYSFQEVQELASSIKLSKFTKSKLASK
jgi:hypothetical protein